jgi:bacterioferritin-associated ferredoxin
MYLCLCRGVNETDLKELGCGGMTTAKEIVQALGLNRPECCGRCLASIRVFVEAAKRGLEESPGASGA